MIAVGGLIRLVGPPLRGAGSFEIKFDVGFDPATGKRKTRYVSFKGNKRDAELELAAWSLRQGGLSIDPSKVTVAEFLERWDRDHAALNCTPKTLERYRRSSKIRSSRTSALL